MFIRRFLAALATTPLLVVGLPAAAVGAELASQQESPSAAVARVAAGPQVGKRVPANALLNKLPVRKERSSTRYSRAKFDHWTTLRGQCDTRTRVLRAETVRKMAPGCSKSGGRWLNEYTGRHVNTATRVEIDHRVALAEAWRSGASAWSTDRRRGFANDLGYQHTLVAVGSRSNTAKSDHDPSQWQPRVGKCKYVARWVAVKYRWGLTVDQEEKRAITKRLASCSRAQKLVKVPAKGKTQAAVTTPSSPPTTGGSDTSGGGGSASPLGWNCPAGYPIKGNADSMIYHLPGGAYYDATNPEECFATEAAARAAGYRASKV